ncbi:UDP-2,3-diacylglucosamine diphosphatase [Malonomonas rubra]|uniref:UDP-2,3-diacylglucosamine diphosphatase n=1 Tax=Malonomonas rubra TaxID=57040 RepID=UPI0026EB1367|nr:UDP-2,3-diacylglucosamine diphosphatase [Malonomonas rubra]
MKAIFLADAHLRQPQDHNYQQLLEFLEQNKDVDGLFLLGDIFEFWLGYKYLTFSAYIPILEKLRQLATNGTRIFFVEGNHDFNLGPYFTETLGCTLITDQQLVEWDGKQLLLSHGDLLNPSRSYHRMRAFWRSGIIRFLSKIVHPDTVWAFAIWLSNQSRKKRLRSKNWDPSYLILPLADSDEAKPADAIICGHFHQPLSTEYQGKQLIAVGDWMGQFSYAEMINGQIELKSYPA